MFNLTHEVSITIKDIPIQWIPKIELYYPDLPQFPIMYIHFSLNNQRIVACPVSVSYKISHDECDAIFYVLTNTSPTAEILTALTNEISNRIGYSNRITRQTVIDCCKGNKKP